jgi:hypothetical protein
MIGAVCVMLGVLAPNPSIVWAIHTWAPSRPPPAPAGMIQSIEMPPLELSSTTPFEDHLNEITGADARNCGRLEPLATAKEMRAALACAVSAAESGQPFLVIKSQYGIDSWVPHGLVRGRAGPILRFSYDDHPGSDKFETRPCVSPVITTERYEYVPRAVNIRSFACAK